MGVTPPFVQIVLVSVKFCFSIVRLSNTLFEAFPLLLSIAKGLDEWRSVSVTEVQTESGKKRKKMGKMLLQTGVL
jgi:hypothetical protein